MRVRCGVGHRHGRRRRSGAAACVAALAWTALAPSLSPAPEAWRRASSPAAPSSRARSIGVVGGSQPAGAPDVYFTPTWHAVADEMLRLARVTSDDVVYDLGSGDGRIVILAAQKYGARGVGVEIDPNLVRLSRQIAREGAVAGRVTFVEGDMFSTDLTDATVVTLYLSPGANRRLEPKLRAELRPGSRIVSHQFRIGRWEPDRTLRASDGTDLFLWVVP